MSEQVKFLGYHEESALPVKRGQTVTIKKGTVIKTTRTDPTTGRYATKVAGRTYKIKIHHILGGSTITELTKRPGETVGPLTNPSVRWPGSSGYWMEVDINDITETFEQHKG
jgi:hypothetical protein